jgi:hypothetical protein
VVSRPAISLADAKADALIATWIAESTLANAGDAISARTTAPIMLTLAEPDIILAPALGELNGSSLSAAAAVADSQRENSWHDLAGGVDLPPPRRASAVSPNGSVRRRPQITDDTSVCGRGNSNRNDSGCANEMAR